MTLIKLGASEPARAINAPLLFGSGPVDTHIYGQVPISDARRQAPLPPPPRSVSLGSGGAESLLPAPSDRGGMRSVDALGSPLYLQLLLLEHLGPRRVEDVVGQLGLAVDVDRRRGLAGQEAVVDFSGALGELEEEEAAGVI